MIDKVEQNQIGIMQGRLTPSRGRGIQFFPFDNWKQEFYTATSLGINEIEFIFDYENYHDNPLFTDKGIREIKRCISDTGVRVNSICFDYFMRRAFYKFQLTEEPQLYAENLSIMQRVCDGAADIGATIVEIPIIDASEICNLIDEEKAKTFINEMICKVDQSIGFGLETNLKPEHFKCFLESFKNERIFANYDSGNSSGLGYDTTVEFESYGSYIRNIHIKDRLLGGSTVNLGTGSADFNTLSKQIKKIGYEGSLILQAARGIDGREEEQIKSQLKFLRTFIL